jgi:hypothetical protein
MLEKELIQSRGFKNVSQGGKVIGFQVPVRTGYYRGVYLSQLRPMTITVDGEKFEGAQITWTIGGKTYAQADLAKYSDVPWQYLEPAILTVSKPGGLKLGIHEVEAEWRVSASYMPPRMDGFSFKNKRKMVLVS